MVVHSHSKTADQGHALCIPSLWLRLLLSFLSPRCF